MPIALISLVDEKRQFWKSEQGLPDVLRASRAAPRETSVCGHVVARNEFLLVEDVLADARFANNPFLLEHGIRFYAGVPLRGASGLALGTVCVMDHRPRRLSRADRGVLQIAADQVMREIEWAVQGRAVPDEPRAAAAD